MMLINKKECRKYADPGLRFSPGSGLLILEKMTHIVRASVKNIARRRTLVLYFYDREKAASGYNSPEYTLFQRRDDYITLHRTEDGTEKWRVASLENLGSRYSNITNTCAFYRQRDEQIATRFCNVPEKDGFEALNTLQTAIKCFRLTKRVLAQEKRVIERMNAIPSVPRGLKGWIHNEVLPHYIFYDYVRGGKAMKAYCTACRKDIMVGGAKYNAYGKCPQCKKAVTFKASGRAKRVWDRATVQMLQKAGDNELVLRIFKICNGLRDWRQPTLSIWENARCFIRQDGSKKMACEAYYYSYNKGTLTNWVKGVRPRFTNYQYHFEGDTCGHLYCGNLGAVLMDTPWQYSQLGRFHQIDREPLEVLPYLKTYHKYPAIEYLVKLGLTKLAAQIIYEHNGAKVINEHGKDLRETLSVEPEDLPVLQKTNANVRQLELCQGLRRHGFRVDETLINWYQERGILTTEDVLIPLKFTTSLKLMRYVDEQQDQLDGENSVHGSRRYDRQGRVLSEYKDYLEMGTKLEYDFSDSFVLFPRNLREAHDQASALYDSRKKAIFDKAIREAHQGLAALYRFTKGDFTIIPPKTANEIVAEGHALHHCAHTYVERVAKGRCIILFVRQKESLKEPYYTVEIQDGRIIQIHGMRHCAPTPEVKKFLAQWERKKLAVANTYNAAA